MIAVGLNQFATGGHVGPVVPTTFAAFPGLRPGPVRAQLLVPSTLAGGTFNAVEELASVIPGIFGQFTQAPKAMPLFGY